jgi:mRNA interferase MazF
MRSCSPRRGRYGELPAIARRPVVVRRRDPEAAAHARGAVCDDHPGIPSEVSLDPDLHPIPRVSAVNLDAVESVSVGALVERLDRLSDERIAQVSLALAIAVTCDV